MAQTARTNCHSRVAPVASAWHRSATPETVALQCFYGDFLRPWHRGTENTHYIEELIYTGNCFQLKTPWKNSFF